MEINTTALAEVLVLNNKRFGDHRGWFSEVLRLNELEDYLNRKVNFVQINESLSLENTLRGIHYLNPHPQGKLVKVVLGCVFDIAVDLRQSSPSFGKWVGEILSAENGKQLWIPEGFGHGFYVLDGPAHFIYSCTDYYCKEAEQCICYNDKALNINWPLKEGIDPIVSLKDLKGLPLKQAKVFA